MGLLDSKQQSAAAIVPLLGVAIVIALSPYVTGLVGVPVLYAVFAPVQQWLARRMREQLAALLVVALALFLIVVPGVSFAGLVVSQAQQIAGSVVRNPILGRLAQLQIAGVDLGPRIADLGAQVVAWIGSSAFGVGGTATRLALNLTISLFGLFYPLLQPGETGQGGQPCIPLSAQNTAKQRPRVRDVTTPAPIGNTGTPAP